MKYFTIRRCVLVLCIAVCIGGTSCSRHFVRNGQPAYTKLHLDSTIAHDPAYVRFYAPYKKQLEAEMNRVVGHAAVDLTKPGSAPETLLGNFFADALLAEGRKTYPDADFSFGTKGGLRIDLQQGPITIGHLFELMPFENELVLLELTGEKVGQLAQFIATTGGQPTAGLRMRIDGSKATAIQIDGHPLDKNRTYQLITYDYLANGGDSSRGLDHPVNRINLGKKVREVLIDYVSGLTQAGQPINTQLDGRITRSN